MRKITMSFFTTPHIRSDQQPEKAAQTTFIDILYNFSKYLNDNDGMISKPISQKKRVGIVGAGPSGLIAAYQLMQVGVDVEIYEANEQHYGGRIYSLHPIDNNPAIFELGAMRVPPSEQIFNYYASTFGMEPSTFPDPGLVDTNIVFDGKIYNWKKGDLPPDIFTTVRTGWENFTQTLEPVASLLKSGSEKDYEEALIKWQALISPSSAEEGEVAYSQISFYQGLVHLFVDNYQKYGLEKPWNDRDFALFGALGLGSGGFGPLYQVNFSEIVRLVINGLETDQMFYTCGLNKLVEGFATTETGNGRVCDKIHYGSKITKVQGAEQASILINNQCLETFDAVIVATTTRAMQIDMGITLPTPAVLDVNNNTGIRELHLMNSSKLFVLTRSKFWNQYKNLPQNIQTDGIVRGLYCLDYEDTDYGVVLVSYTWGDDSTKYIAIKDPVKRLKLLIESLTPFNPEFTDVLKDEILYEHTKLIDWQDQAQYYGAFKLNYPGQDYYNQSLYYQFTKSTNNVYLAGDSISWSGGWIEGALQTGMNAATAVINQISPSSLHNNNPMEQAQRSSQYNYG